MTSPPRGLPRCFQLSRATAESRHACGVSTARARIGSSAARDTANCARREWAAPKRSHARAPNRTVERAVGRFFPRSERTRRSMVTVVDVMNSRKNSPQAQRFAERRRREDEAPRLQEEIPSLVTLEFGVEDRSSRTSCDGCKYTRRIIVGRAPALFLVPCSDPRCAGNEHDLTYAVMRALRSSERLFQGDDDCGGSVGPSPCSRVLRFEAVATYK